MVVYAAVTRQVFSRLATCDGLSRLLTYMLTLPIFLQRNWIAQWSPKGNQPALRTFYYIQGWKIGVDGLDGATKTGVIRPASPRGRVVGLVERFVCGDPKATLVRPQGDGMDPVFQRMRAPNFAVVEMRTQKTRTFGFFARVNTYVAISIAETATLKTSTKSDPYEQQAAKVQAVIRRLGAADVDRTTDVEKLVTDVFL
jgi:hypothetical protein